MVKEFGRVIWPVLIPTSRNFSRYKLCVAVEAKPSKDTTRMSADSMSAKLEIWKGTSFRIKKWSVVARKRKLVKRMAVDD